VLEAGNANWFRHVAQRIFDNHPVPPLAENQPNARLVVRMAQQIVHRRKVEVQLAGILGLEIAALQLNHDERAQTQVVTQQVELKLLPANLNRKLAPHESKTHAQFQEKLPDVLHQGSL